MAQQDILDKNIKDKFACYFLKITFKDAIAGELNPKLKDCAIIDPDATTFLGCSDKASCACDDWSTLIFSEVHKVYIDTKKEHCGSTLYDSIKAGSSNNGYEIELDVSVA